MNRKAECDTQHGMIGYTWFAWLVPEKEVFFWGGGKRAYYLFLKRVWNRALLLCHDSQAKIPLIAKDHWLEMKNFSAIAVYVRI